MVVEQERRRSRSSAPASRKRSSASRTGWRAGRPTSNAPSSRSPASSRSSGSASRPSSPKRSRGSRPIARRSTRPETSRRPHSRSSGKSSSTRPTEPLLPFGRARGPRGGRSPRRRRDEAAPQGARPPADRTHRARGARRRQEDPGAGSPTSSAASWRHWSGRRPGCTGRFAEAAALQFDAAVKSAREDAARRLARELDRAVHMFAREAESVLAERLAQVADSGTQRVEKRLAQVTAGLERQRDEFIASLHKRLAQLELELRERMRAASRTKPRRSGRRSTAGSRSSPGARTRRSRPAADGGAWRLADSPTSAGRVRL